MRGRTALALWLPPLIYAAAIFIASGDQTPPTAPGGLSDKHQHFIAYAGLSLLVLRALAGASWHGVSARVCVVAALVATAYGASDELHQHFVPGRFADGFDLLADATGAALAALLALIVARLRVARTGIGR